MCLYGEADYHSIHVRLKGQLYGIDFLFLPLWSSRVGFGRSGSCSKQAPLPVEPTGQPSERVILHMPEFGMAEPWPG